MKLRRPLPRSCSLMHARLTLLLKLFAFSVLLVPVFCVCVCARSCCDA